MIGLKIKQYREKIGLTQEELGEKVGFTSSPRQRIAQIESGYRNPSAETLRNICEVLETTPGELVGIVPEKVKEILTRGDLPTLKTEEEFYYIAGVFVATLISLYPASKKYKVDYFQPINICNGQKLKDRIQKDLLIEPTARIFSIESSIRNKLIAAFFGWQSEVDNLKKFNKLNLFESYSLGYFQTVNYPII